MEYMNPDGYFFNIIQVPKNNRTQIEKFYTYIYNKKSNTNINNTLKRANSKSNKHINTSIDSHHFLYNRVFGGLLSININTKTHDYYIKRFNTFTTKYINNTFTDFNNNKKYKYGIDEAIILYIIPNIRPKILFSNTKNSNTKKSNTTKSNTKKSNTTNSNTPKLLSSFSLKLVNSSSCKGICNGEELPRSDCVEDNTIKDNCDLSDIYMNLFNFKKIIGGGWHNVNSFINFGFNPLTVLSNQYPKIYNFLGSLPFKEMEYYKVNTLTEFSILKGIDYNIKYIFAIKEEKYEENYIYHNDDNSLYLLYKKLLSLLNKGTTIDYCTLVELDISTRNTIDSSVVVFLENLETAYSKTNFKPLIIHPANLTLSNDEKIPFTDILSK